MKSALYESVRKNYIAGYGMPLRYYSDEQVEALAKKGVISEAECKGLLEEKANALL